MSATYATGRKAKAICDVCGFTYRLAELRTLRRAGRDTSLKACSECWEPDHPQNELGKYPVRDPQALRDPRPDSAELSKSRELIFPMDGEAALGQVGRVTVTTA